MNHHCLARTRPRSLGIQKPRSSRRLTGSTIPYSSHAATAFSTSKSVMDSVNDGGWGDLFAKAADIVTDAAAESPAQNQANDEAANPIQVPHSKKKRKRKRGSLQLQEHQHKGNADFQAMLEGRMNPDPAPSVWSNGSFLSSRMDSVKNMCNGWQDDDSVKLCQRCGKDALCHRMEVGNFWTEKLHSKERDWPLSLFAAIRNIRCCAKLIAVSHDFNQLEHLYPHLTASIEQEWHDVASSSRSSNILSNDESIVLNEKLDELQKTTTATLSALERRMRKHKSNGDRETLRENGTLFQHAIRTIIACDACYYRLYYMQLIGMLPFCHGNESNMKPSPVFLPHPQEYFKSLLIRKKPSEEFLPLHELGENDVGDHPLARIHTYRMLETSELLTRWSQSEDGVELVKQCLANSISFITGLDRHETPAPHLLSEWRDSCRDFMCNILAYATLPPKTLLEIRNTLHLLGVKRMIDYGAGTGYIAKLLCDVSKDSDSDNKLMLKIEAYDIVPPPFDSKAMKTSAGGTANEYHGKTPAFFRIKEWKSNDNLESKMRGREKSTALLLCYPPPESSMAFDATKAFLEAGGSHAVHIGEFKGVTGNDAFEKLLIRKMKCIKRFPTLTWGTDASTVTIWSLAAKQRETISVSGERLLLPCTTCSVREAKKRCRLERTLVYCSDRCFRDGSTLRCQQLKVQMIAFDCLQFENSRHFDSL